MIRNLLAGIAISLLLSLSPHSSSVQANDGDTHTHFRFSHITWREAGPNTAEFTFVAAFRRCTEPGVGSAYPGSDPDGCPAVGDVFDEFIGRTELCFGDGECTGQLRFKVFALNKAENWLLGRALEPSSDSKETVSHTYSDQGPFTAFTATCCRIRAPKHINNPSGEYRVETTVAFQNNAGSPESLLIPIINCPTNAACSFDIVASGPDDPNCADCSWRLSTSGESGLVQPGSPHANNAASVITACTDSLRCKGIYSWDTTGADLNPGGETLYSTQVTIEDGSGAKSAIDFLIRLVEVPLPPEETIRIPIRWCGIEGSPSMVDPSVVGANSRDSVLLLRHVRAAVNIYLKKENEANITFFSGTADIALPNFPIIDDPNPPAPDGTGPGELGDIFVDLDSNELRELKLAANDCRAIWDAAAPGVTGIIAIHLNRFVDDQGRFIVDFLGIPVSSSPLGLGITSPFSNSAIQILTAYASAVDNAYLRSDSPIHNDLNPLIRLTLKDDLEKVVAHELGHTLSLNHGDGVDDDNDGDLDERDEGDSTTGNNLMQTSPFGGVGDINLTSDQASRIRTQAALHIPDRRINPTLPPLGNSKADMLGEVPEAEAFIDLDTIGLAVDQEAETTTFAALTFDIFPENISGINYVFLGDLDNDQATGGLPSTLGIPTTAEGIELVGKVRVDVVAGAPQVTPTVWRFEAGQFVEVVDPSILAEVTPVSIGLTCLVDTPGCELDSVTIAESVQLRLSNEVRGPMATEFPLTGIAENPNSGTFDTVDADLTLVPPAFPECRVTPSGAILGSQVSVEASGLPSNAAVDVFIADRNVTSESTDETGATTIEVAVPTDVSTGVMPVMVVAAGTAISADCVLNLVATPSFDVPPSPPSGSSFAVTVGETLTFSIQASDADPGDVITLEAIGVPLGAEFPIPAPNNPVSTTFAWTPSPDQIGVHFIVFTGSDNTGLATPPHTVIIEVRPVEVGIDIWPFLERNIIFLGKDHPVPVAVLSTDTFDAPNEVDRESLTFGRTGDEDSLRRCRRHAFDVNKDRLKDLVCVFRSGPAGFQDGDTEGVLKGLTIEGVPFEGQDSVFVLPAKETRLFQAHLGGDKEVPPVETAGGGHAVFTLKRGEAELRFLVSLRRMEKVTAIHIHCAPGGENGPIGVTLYDGAATNMRFFKGVVTKPDDGNECGWEDLATVVMAMRSGDTYVNVHTEGHPRGEIRGQIEAIARKWD